MKKTAVGLLSGALACAVALSCPPPPEAHAAVTGDFDIERALAIPELANLRVDTSEVMLDNPAVTPYGVSAEYQAPYSAYTTTLRNDLPYPQTLTSQSNTVTTWDTTTSSTEVGAALRVKNELDRKVSVTVLGTGVEVTHRLSVEVEASFRRTDTATKTVTNAWTVPSQAISVPAHTSVTVQALMQRASFSGKLKLEGDIVGNVKFANRCGEKFSVPVGRVLALQKNDGTVVTPSSVVPAGDTARFSGEGSFSGVAGTSMSVTVTENGTTRTLQNIGTAPASGTPTGRSAMSTADPAAPLADTTGIATFAGLAEELGCGTVTDMGGHAFTLGSDGRISFVADGPARVVSPAGVTFTSVSADPTPFGNMGLGIAADGSVWSAHDGRVMQKIAFPGKAKATAGHAFVLGEDGRVSYVADGRVTVVSPSGVKFASVTGDWAAGQNYGLGIDENGDVWSARDSDPMVKLALAGKARATAAHAFVLGENGRISYVADGRVTVVSPSSRTFVSLTGNPAGDGNRGLAIANDGTVWSAHDSIPMVRIDLPRKATTTAGHAFILSDDGRVSYIADGRVTVVTPSEQTITSLEGNATGTGNYALAIDAAGTPWALKDSEKARDLEVEILRR